MRQPINRSLAHIYRMGAHTIRSLAHTNRMGAHINRSPAHTNGMALHSDRFPLGFGSRPTIPFCRCC